MKGDLVSKRALGNLAALRQTTLHTGAHRSKPEARKERRARQSSKYRFQGKQIPAHAKSKVYHPRGSENSTVHPAAQRKLKQSCPMSLHRNWNQILRCLLQPASFADPLALQEACGSKIVGAGRRWSPQRRPGPWAGHGGGLVQTTVISSPQCHCIYLVYVWI